MGCIKETEKQQNRTKLVATGQAGFIIESISGKRLAVDLYLSHCVEREEGHVGFKRLLPPLFSPEEVNLDIIIATHSHYDHFDIDAMPDMMKNKYTRLFASLNCEREVNSIGLSHESITYVKPGDYADVGDFVVHFIDCDHGTGAPDAVGVIVEVDGKRILEVGDTCLHLDWIEKYLEFGEIDVLIAPINGAYGNLNEEECARLSQALKPKLTIPCHYGMFASHGGNPGLFMEKMQEHCPENKYLLMMQGEYYTL